MQASMWTGVEESLLIFDFIPRDYANLVWREKREGGASFGFGGKNNMG